MVFIKVQKSSAYFSRYQVKYRRRREGKTDYYARKRLVVQDKNKYNSPKYRLVVRFTNQQVICQIVAAAIEGDKVVCAATSRELTRYGINFGLKNFAAAYATGLLLARRLLQKFKLDSAYPGVVKATGELYEIEPVADGPRPFSANLDVGLVRTTTGNRVFAAMKGAIDGGIAVPHSETRFPGVKGDKANPKLLKSMIFGGHVKKYMAELAKDDDEAYQKQFSQFIANGIKADAIEQLYTKAHAAIRANPAFVKSTAPATWQKKPRAKKINLAQRKNRIQQILRSRK